MGAEVQAGAGVGGRGMMARLQAQVGDSLRNGAEQATVYAERIVARLDDIRAVLDSIAGEEEERTNATKGIAANTTERLADGRSGYMGTIERIAVTADAATTVDVFVGSESDLGFRHRLTFAAAGRDQAAVEIDVPENAQILARAGAGAVRIVLQIKRQKS